MRVRARLTEGYSGHRDLYGAVDIAHTMGRVAVGRDAHVDAAVIVAAVVVVLRDDVQRVRVGILRRTELEADGIRDGQN